MYRFSDLRLPDARTGPILEALAKAGVFRLRAVVVGTAAYQTYPGLIGTRLPTANAITDDPDLAHFPERYALNKLLVSRLRLTTSESQAKAV